jgi:DNA-binding transcriptional MocR family regulator
MCEEDWRIGPLGTIIRPEGDTIHSQSELNGLNQDAADVPRILSNWTARRGPLYQRLAAALRGAIQRGDLPDGTRLPPERQLAEQLLISRSTVVAAYELLRQDEILDRRQGSGTRVVYAASPRAAVEPSGRLTRALARNTLFRRITEGPDETIDLVGAYLLNAGELPVSMLAGLERDIATLSQGSGYAPLGYPPLRRAVAQHVSRSGLPTTPEEVLVTGGAQQALHLAACLYLQNGDTVIVENPTYPGALDAFAMVGARFAWVSTGRQGADVNALSDLVARVAPRLMYLIPTYHNPVGGVMPERQRRVVARLVEDTQLPTIDDQSLAALGLVNASPPPPIASFAPNAPLLTIDSVSKFGWSGLRVGWIRAPEDVIARLGRVKAVADLGGALPSQLIATRLLESFDTLRQERRRLLAERHDLMSALLAQLLPTWSWERPQGGLCLWVRLPHGNTQEFAQVALRHGVSIVAGPVASPDGSFGDYLRLPFGRDPATIERAVQRLASAWNDYVPLQESRRQSLEVVV